MIGDPVHVLPAGSVSEVPSALAGDPPKGAAMKFQATIEFEAETEDDAKTTARMMARSEGGKLTALSVARMEETYYYVQLR